MEYKIVTVKAKQSLLGVKFERTAEKLSAEVNEQLAGGWEPQGGVGVGLTHAYGTPYLFQALVKKR